MRPLVKTAQCTARKSSLVHNSKYPPYFVILMGKRLKVLCEIEIKWKKKENRTLVYSDSRKKRIFADS